MATGRFFPVEIFHLGQYGTVATFNEETLPATAQLGQTLELNNKVYRLIKFNNGAGNIASAAGSSAHWMTRADFVVTSDRSSGEFAGNGIAGGFLGVLTDGYYGFIQIGGLQTLKSNGTANAAGDLLCGDQAHDTDGTLEIMAAVTALPVAVCQAGDGGTTTNAAYWLLGTLL